MAGAWPWLALLALVPLLLYALHRLALWLEARGQLYYWHKKPDGARPANVLAPLQEALDPPTKHVHRVPDQRRKRSDGEAPGGPDEPSCRGA